MTLIFTQQSFQNLVRHLSPMPLNTLDTPSKTMHALTDHNADLTRKAHEIITAFDEHLSELHSFVQKCTTIDNSLHTTLSTTLPTHN
ncbi:hypothetical protein EML15_04560 [Corynebacterium sp. sy017]|nr:MULTISPECIES: hypothetical protein [unclassified Corynebacterium]MBP3088418.1 hypothetical protein [Corynebacterium sp. sy017]QDZ41856.1 hypothetical protein FQV43_00750 [Corynebacterium sp. sy039]TSD91729.1 hypothetical protein ELY17_04560 [Corynebacterium sp. SY003]